LIGFPLRPAFSVAAAVCLTMAMICFSASIAISISYYFATPWWASMFIGGVLGHASGRITIAWMKWRIKREIARAEAALAAVKAEMKRRGMEP
jgi:hypothetical protein